MEMVQGEGGVNPATPRFAQRVRRLTRRLGIPLIIDEVQTGCGRTGTWFAFEQYHIEPDIIVASKALSGMASRSPSSCTTGTWTSGLLERTPARSAATSSPSPQAQGH